jgi:hypothetical protein
MRRQNRRLVVADSDAGKAYNAGDLTGDSAGNQ